MIFTGESTRNCCKNCHFLAKTHVSSDGGVHPLLWDHGERSRLQLKDYYRAECFKGVWSTRIARLKPDFAAAYNNRGKAKAVLGLKDEARKDFETALELAQKAGNANIVAQAEQSLRGLDADGGR